MEPVGPAGSVSWNFRAHDPDLVDFLYQDVDFLYPVVSYVTTALRNNFDTGALSLVGATAADGYPMAGTCDQPAALSGARWACRVGWIGLHTHVEVRLRDLGLLFLGECEDRLA